MGGNGGPGQNSPAYAQALGQTADTQFASQVATEKAAILADTSIDAISQQELIAQLNAGQTQLENAAGTTTNDQTLTNIEQSVMGNVQAGVTEDASDDPLYQGRRFLQAQAIQLATTPGRAQTVLTQRQSTPSGTPTLLTSGANSPMPSTANATPGSILTGH